MESSRRQFLATAASAVAFDVSQTEHAMDTACSSLGVRYDRWMFPAIDKPLLSGIRHEVVSAHPEGGRGPDVVALHEITGASAMFFCYVNTLVREGFSVHCPVLFGAPFTGWWGEQINYLRACGIGGAFDCWALEAHNPLTTWLTGLADHISGDDGRPIGAIGMCLTGVLPLAMLRCRAVVAPVLCQPAVPFGSGEPARLDVGLAPADLDFALARVRAEGLNVLLLRFKEDPLSSGPRADRLEKLFDPRLNYVKLDPPERGSHSSLVHSHAPKARAEVVKFLREQLARRSR